MADLFGTPLGTLAAGEEQRANVANTLGALKTMGEISQQPADLALKQSHARYYSAEAAQKEAEAADLQAMSKLEAQFHALGKNPTVADLAAGPRQPQSQADEMIAFAAFAEGQGAPLRVTGKIRETASKVLEHEAIAGYRTAQEVQIKQKAQTEHAVRVGNVAAAAAESPQGYMNIRQDPELSKLLPPQLSGDWNTDRRILNSIASASQDSIRRARLMQQATEVGLADKRTKAGMASAEATKDLAKARKIEVDERAERLRKHGGERSAEAAESRKAQTEARRAAVEAKFPGIESTPSPLLIGKNRTLPTGERVTIVGINPNGTYRLQKYVGVASATQAPVAAADEEED